MFRSIVLALLISGAIQSYSQSRQLPAVHHCGTSEAMAAFYHRLPDQQGSQHDVVRGSGGGCFVIPVVFHVYGQTQSGYPVNLDIIQGALDLLNADMHGLNTDFDLVHQEFLDIRETMPEVEFILAQLDPEGNPTNGIVQHPVASGYGNGDGYDDLIAADAWDNYKYMNIYVQNDLYNNGVTNNSGVAWYPATWMSDNNLARIVYNGAYLGENCDWEPEFASTMTHEVGHWLNLIHTFQDGCQMPNDEVTDTPPCDYWQDGYDCHPNNLSNYPLNCNDILINAENYMDYAGAYGCYRMFTEGQVERMYTALNHPTRYPLWQYSNLIATGLDEYCDEPVGIEEEGVEMKLYKCESSRICFRGFLEENFAVQIFDLSGRQVFQTLMTDANSSLELEFLPTGTYIVQAGPLVGKVVLN